MSLSDALKIETTRRPGPRCTLCMTITKLPPADVASLQDAMDDKGVTSSAISRALVSEGYDIRSETVRRHRKNECAGL